MYTYNKTTVKVKAAKDSLNQNASYIHAKAKTTPIKLELNRVQF